MGSSQRSGCPIGLGIIGVLVVIMLMPGNSVLKSPEETQEVLDRLGVAWDAPGPPVIVFSNPG